MRQCTTAQGVITQSIRSSGQRTSGEHGGTWGAQAKNRRAGFIGAILWGALLAALGAGLAVAPVWAQTPVVEARNADEEAVLQVNEDGGLLGLGVFGTGMIPAEGAGARLMWYPGKAAFHAGSVGVSSDGTEWDDANVGNWSVAFGRNTTASGRRSVAMGDGATAFGNQSTAMGLLTTASGPRSTAMGFETTASGQQSTALGRETTASGTESTAMGSGTRASGDRSMATGSSTEASGLQSVAMGNRTTASGISSTAMGNSTTASGFASMAMGSGATASGEASTAMGSSTTAQAYGSLVIGRHNVIAGNPSGWNATDPLFVAGNGSGNASRSNALTLLKNGNLTIAGDLTQSSDRRLKTDIAPLGDVLAALVRIGPVRYRFKDDTSRPAGPQIGLIAQEVQRAFPELVTHGADGYLSVAYPKLTAVLLNGLQEQQHHIEAQQAEIETQQTEIDALEARLAVLEARVQDDTSVIAGWSGWGAAGLLVVLMMGGLIVRRLGSWLDV